MKTKRESYLMSINQQVTLKKKQMSSPTLSKV